MKRLLVSLAAFGGLLVLIGAAAAYRRSRLYVLPPYDREPY